MRDGMGRRLSYLRLSVTRACSMRCLYCRPPQLQRLADPGVLAADEIVALVEHLVEHHGVRKVRLTGGEPTTRQDLLAIIRRLSGIDCLGELVMTTNGLTLARDASRFADAGLHRINVSLDSLDPDRFSRLTGVDGLSRVTKGIVAAQSAGLTPVRLNTVVVGGENDVELPELVAFAAAHRCEIRFIELMPMGPLAAQWRQRYVPEARMRERLVDTVRYWEPLPTDSASAQRYIAHLADGQTADVGFISAMSHCFCGRCDRIRIGADGTLYPCLMDEPRGNVRHALRPRFDAAVLDQILHEGFVHKPKEHPAVGPAIMTHVGG